MPVAVQTDHNSETKLPHSSRLLCLLIFICPASQTPLLCIAPALHNFDTECVREYLLIVHYQDCNCRYIKDVST